MLVHDHRSSPSTISVSPPVHNDSARRNLLLTAITAALLAGVAVPALAQTVPLGNATPFSVLGATAITNTGNTVVIGDLGISPNTASSVTGFPPGVVMGATHFADAVALDAQNDLTLAYTTLANRACGTTVASDLGGSVLVPGVYCSGSSMGLTGALTLDAQGDPNAVFVFQIGSALTTASNASVNIINGGQSCNVFWQIGSSATLGTGTSFQGNIIAQSSITLNTGSGITGRLLARTGAVTLANSAITVCSLAGGVLPALEKSFNPNLILADGTSTLTITLSNPNPAVATLTAPLVDTLPPGVLVAPVPNVNTTCGGAGAPVAVAGTNTATLPAGRTIPANGLCTLTLDVTAALVGTYVNTLPIDALMTTNGNNPAPASDDLRVVAFLFPDTPVPTLSTWATLLLGTLLAAIAALALRVRAA
jgi:hypothetical protein